MVPQTWEMLLEWNRLLSNRTYQYFQYADMDYLGWGWGYSVIFFKFIWPQNQLFDQHVTYKFSRIHFRKWWFCSVFFILQLLCFIMLVSQLRLLTAAAKLLQSCPTVRPHRQQPTRLPRPWDSPGKNTGVGCHFLLQCMKVKSESEVTQSCLTLSNSMDCSLPGSSVRGIVQARVLKWVAFAFWLFHFVQSHISESSSLKLH